MRRFALLVVTTLAAAGLLAWQPAAAATGRIGLVVRYADGNVSTACVAAGGSGLAVLERGYAAKVGTAPPYAGFVFTINNFGTTHPDDTHYWSYWHAAGSGAFSYSNAGAGSSTPKAGTVDGWSYLNGTGAVAPPSYTYAALCGAPAEQPPPSSTHHSTAPAQPSSTHRPNPAPKPKATTAASARPPAASHGAGSHAPQAGSAGSRPGGAAPSTSARTGATRTPDTSTRSSLSTGPSGARSDATSSTTASATATSAHASPVAAGHAADPPTRKSAAGFPGWATALALLLVAGIGTAAWLRTRRQPE